MNLDRDVKIYVITHTPWDFLYSNVIVPIATNKTVGDKLNIISSDQGDNINYLNNFVAEFSTFYWAWKNDITSKYIGFFHYKRYLMINDKKMTFDNNTEQLESCGLDNEYIKSIFDEYDLIVPAKQTLYTNVYLQYCFCQPAIYLDTALDIIRRKYRSHYQSFCDAFQANSGYFCNLFVMRREDFNEYMEFTFDILEEMKKVLMPFPTTKIFAYVLERIFCGYVEYLKVVKGFRIKETPVLYYVNNQCSIMPTTGY